MVFDHKHWKSARLYVIKIRPASTLHTEAVIIGATYPSQTLARLPVLPTINRTPNSLKVWQILQYENNVQINISKLPTTVEFTVS